MEANLTFDENPLITMLCLDTTMSELRASSKSGMLESFAGKEAAFDARVVDQTNKTRIFSCFEGSMA
jgi:hypothetical protein